MINLRALNQFVRVEHFKNGGSLPITRLTPTKGLDGENGFERCLPPNPNPPRSPPSPPIHLGAEVLQVPVPPICAIRVFTTLLKSVVGLLRQIGLYLIVYLDNMLFMHTHKDQLKQ